MNIELPTDCVDPLTLVIAIVIACAIGIKTGFFIGIWIKWETIDRWRKRREAKDNGIRKQE